MTHLNNCVGILEIKGEKIFGLSIEVAWKWLTAGDNIIVGAVIASNQLDLLLGIFLLVIDNHHRMNSVSECRRSKSTRGDV